MARKGWLIWQGYTVRWEYKAFRSKRDLTFNPHFELTVASEEPNVSITFDNVVIKDRALAKIDDFTKLPERERNSCLNILIETLRKEITPKADSQQNTLVL